MSRPIVTLMQRAKELLPAITVDLDIGSDGITALATLLARINYQPHSKVLPEARQSWVSKLSGGAMLSASPHQRVRRYQKFVMDTTDATLKDIERVLEWRSKYGDTDIPESERFTPSHTPVDGSEQLISDVRPKTAVNAGVVPAKAEQEDLDEVAEALMADSGFENAEWSAW
ncbi:hypothetical protein [Burkholderia vietnamiensis]|uniref:hypothetical protein n=1 Tax=Burkholderia vietnamiensis TaxID=60552 RepID=UPI001CABE83B|nr:hypothetical protein [Burkholderia vietnamiensis]CAG9228735.1 hypothetical protein BVI1335_70087 [Burkholderia vietnamiensis]HDR9086381.1 hypothetical protein [Burkholderia vietnamiensis]